jgi:hypothetical protein
MIVVAGMISLGHAAGTDTFQITVSVAQTLSVNVTTGTTDGTSSYNASISSTSLPTNYATVLPTPFYIWNDSPLNAASIQNYSLSGAISAGVLGTNFSAGGSTAVNAWTFAAVFTSTATAPAVAVSDFDSTDAITGSSLAWAADGAKFSPANDSLEYVNKMGETRHTRNVNAGEVDLRLWIAVATPAAVTTGGNNPTFTVTITAGLAS